MGSAGNRPPRVQLEVGREGDVDRLTHLGWTNSEEIQRILAKSTRLTLPLRGVCRPDQAYKFRLVLEGETDAGTTREIEIGQMSETFHFDLNEVWSQVDPGGKFRPGDYMEHLYFIGATTVALSDSERMAVRPPYSSSGFALAPLIKGLTLAQFKYRRRRRS